MDSMTDAELDGKVDLGNFKTDPKVESRIRRIAAGSGTHPKEVMMLLQVHKQFEGMVGKSKGLFGKNAQAKQQQMAAQMQKNPKLIQQRLNQMVGSQIGGVEGCYSICLLACWFAMLFLQSDVPSSLSLRNFKDPKMLQQMGGRDKVMAMMQQVRCQSQNLVFSLA